MPGEPGVITMQVGARIVEPGQASDDSCNNAMLRGRLRTPAIKVAPGTAEAAIAHVRLVAERLALINRQLDHARRQLDRLVRQLTEAAPADASTASVEAEPASSKTPADATILLSLPGIGTGVLATLLAEGSDALRRRDYHALRCCASRIPNSLAESRIEATLRGA